MINKLVLCVLAVGLCQTCLADQQQYTIDSPEVQQSIRTKHDRSSTLPDGIAYMETIDYLIASEQAFGAGSAALSISKNMGVSMERAQALFPQFEESFNEIQSQIDEKTIEIGCDSGNPRYYNDEAYAALERIDDAREQVADREFDAQKQALPENEAARLHQWIELQKSKIVHIKFDYRKFDQLTGRDQTATLSKICTRN